MKRPKRTKKANQGQRPITSSPHADTFAPNEAWFKPDPVNMMSRFAPRPAMDQEPGGQRIADAVKARLDAIRENGIVNPHSIVHDQDDGSGS
jgi:hypothetical protein